MRIKNNYVNIAVFLGVFVFVSCRSQLKPFEMGYVQDRDMLMDVEFSSIHQNYIYTIREGSIPTIVIKGNGGCGCN